MLGEGAGVLVLESEEHARARGARIYAEVLGAGITADAHDIAQPDPAGPRRRPGDPAGARGVRRSRPSDIAHINAHATSTPQGDIAEGLMIHATLGSHADEVVVTSTKSMTGHLLGGAGALEAIATVLAIHHRVEPADDQPRRQGPAGRARHPDHGPRPARRRHRGAEQLLRLRRRQRRRRLRERLMRRARSGAAPIRAPPPRGGPARHRHRAVTKPPARRTRATRSTGSPPSSTRARWSRSRPTTTRGMLAAVGRVNGRRVVAFCSDATVMGGAMGDEGCQRGRRRLPPGDDRPGTPIIGLWHSGGARLAEGVLSLHAVGRIFQVMTQASGKIPQISVVLGPAAGGAAYGPALTDVVILGPEGRIFVTGPDVVRSVTGEDVDMLRLGGPEPHGRRSGVVHILTESEQEALERARTVASLLGSQGSWTSRRSRTATCPQMLPESKKRAYDVHPLVAAVLDDGTDAGAPRALGPQHRHRARPLRRPHRRRRGQQPAPARRLPRLAVGREGLALRPAVRRARRPADRPGRRARLPAGRRPGVGRRRTPRREAAARVRRVRRPPGHAGDPQDLRRRLHRDELPRARRDQGLRLAGRRGGGDGRRWPRSAILHRRKLAEVAPEIRPQVEAELAAEHERLAGGVDKAVEIGVVDEVVEPGRTRSRDRPGDRRRGAARRRRGGTATSRSDARRERPRRTRPARGRRLPT